MQLADLVLALKALEIALRISKHLRDRRTPRDKSEGRIVPAEDDVRDGPPATGGTSACPKAVPRRPGNARGAWRASRPVLRRRIARDGAVLRRASGRRRAAGARSGNTQARWRGVACWV